MYIYQPEKILIKQQVKKYSRYIKGKALDAGAGRANRYRDLFNCDEYIKMDIDKSDNIDVVGSVENIPFKDKTFDSIVCMQVLGDIENPQGVIQEFYRVLKPKGTVLLTESLMAHTIPANEMTEKPNEDYWRFTEFILKRLFEKTGFEIIVIDKRGGFFTVILQDIIRYLIVRLDLYSHQWARIVNIPFKLLGKMAICLDKIDKHKANKRFALGWCIIARK